MKLLRTIRFDQSDERVFEVAAAPAEWAVSGAFEFAALSPEAITGKVRQAFANGFLGVASFGRSTFATVAEATSKDREEIEDRLARHVLDRYGAPDMEAALRAAREEVEFAAGLARDAQLNAVLTVRRTLTSAGEMKEEFRLIRPPSGEPLHAKIWTVVDDET